jgi:hypothetical protein
LASGPHPVFIPQSLARRATRLKTPPTFAHSRIRSMVQTRSPAMSASRSGKSGASTCSSVSGSEQASAARSACRGSGRLSGGYEGTGNTTYQPKPTFVQPFGWSSFSTFVSPRSLELRSAPPVNPACAAPRDAYTQNRDVLASARYGSAPGIDSASLRSIRQL